MRYEITEAVFKLNGSTLQPGAGATVTVNDLTGNELTVYEAATGSTTVANPQTTDSGGRIEGWVEAPDYDLAVTGSGITAYTQEIRQSPIVNVKSYGAVGDGVADDSAAIQAAIDEAGSVFFPRGTYKLGTTLELASNVHLLGEPGATLDSSTTTKISSARIAIRAVGQLASGLTLSANATKGEFVTTLNDASTISAADWVMESSTAEYPYDTGHKKGEIKRVRSKASNTLTFEHALEDSYATADTAAVKKITFVENVSITGLRIVGSNTAADGARAISLQLVNGFTIRDCQIDQHDVFGIELNAAIRGEVSGNRIRGVLYDGVTGTSFYGVSMSNAAQWIRVLGNHGERLRHLAVVSSNADYDGAPRHIVVDGNVATDCMAGGAGRSWAYEHHGVGEDIVFSNNVADGCFGGFVIRGPGVSVVGNTIRNWYERAIDLHTGELEDARDILIANNTIAARTVESGGSTTSKAIAGNLANVTTLRNVVIAGNTIEVDDPDHQGAGIDLAGGIDAPGLVVRDNTIVCLTTATDYVIAVEPERMLVLNNRIVNAGFGIRCLDSNQDVIGNTIECASVPGSGTMIHTAFSGTRVIRNVLRNPLTGVRLASGATGAAMIGNVASGASNAGAFAVSEAAPGPIRDNVHTSQSTSLASAATVTLPTGNGEFYEITGTTTITSVAASYYGRRVTLKFAGILTFTDGSNLKLNANFVTSADDTITLVCDGTNWFEVARSAN